MVTTANKNVLNNGEVSKKPECKHSGFVFLSGLSETERAITEEHAQH